MPVRKKPSVTILIPALNEGKLVKDVVRDSLKMTDYDIRPLIVLDSKANEKTRKAAQASGATILDIGKGLGKGNAVKQAIPHLKTEYVIQIDADYQFIPQEIPDMMKYLLSGYDVTLGTRYQKGSKIETDSVSLLRLFGSYFLSAAASVAARQRITDVMAGFKGFKTKVLKDLNPQTNHFGYEAELAVRAVKKGYKVINVPISYKKREVGVTNVSSIKHGWLVLKTIIQTGKE